MTKAARRQGGEAAQHADEEQVAVSKHSALSTQHSALDPQHWVPDNADGSGWADVDWVSAVRGSRYHYRHGAPLDEVRAARPLYYRIVTRLESATLSPHENSYFVAADSLADFLAELLLAGGAEVIWHVEPCADPPSESRIR